MSIDREIGRLSAAVSNIEADIAEIKGMLSPLVAERHQRQGMSKLAGWGGYLLSAVISAATALGINWTTLTGGR